MIHVFYTYLDQPQHSELLKKYTNTLPLVFQERLSKFRRWQDQQASLLGRILLVKGVKQLYGCALPEIVFGQYGKPLFKDGDIHFNISHSHKLVVCAITKNSEIGIDVEYQKPIDIQDFKFQMTDQEWQWISTVENSQAAFYEYWTKKEAVIKAVGKGFSADLKSFEVLDGTDQMVLENQEWQLLEADIDADYLCHLAASLDCLVKLISIQP
ncbi:MAG: 4'-phosphopantetheinyl transferase superfamily protein [Bacteroidota bacterium]